MITAEKTSDNSNVVTASRFSERLDAEGFPEAPAWESAAAVRFTHDWRGENADPQRETEVRLLWTPHLLYVRFLARYRSITVFPEAESNGRRDHLWDRDVAEVFLQAPGSHPRCYTEFEVSPNGFWIDLDIAPGAKRNLRSGLRRRVLIDEISRSWRAELELPMKALSANFEPATPWRVNFFRLEGPQEPRFYSAWQPTRTPAPNFHVPEAFGKLIFEA